MPTRPRTKLLGVDFGTVRVGLAICDEGRMIAAPHDIRVRKNPQADGNFFKDLVAKEQIAAIVMGLPVHTDGREGVKAKESRAYGKWLGEVTGLPVMFADERFSTAFADSAMWEAGLKHKKRKELRDAIAAQIMLQGFLDGGAKETEIISLSEQKPETPPEE
ncbi:Holliday junction resolvase RuvX [Zavarzinella formosa]|uniref:Holliday junction resolvase RuvX n=1 Tax=Zavarzinella formosa TaxID=360055 RepID=UPI0002FE6ED1|nr:Holliday junction resolvase RuvX [Zavarzinella formosa]